MSSEEAHREAQRRDQEMIQAQSGTERVSSWNSRRKSSKDVPPMPSHMPPAPPSGPRSPEAREVAERAIREARRTDKNGSSELNVPDRVLATSASGSTQDNTRGSMQHDTILPIVEEAGEEQRPETPAKNNSWSSPPSRAPPPTPPKSGYGKPNSPDSGYAGNGSNGTITQPRLSQDSLNKALPPLPNKGEAEHGGIRMVA